MTPQLSFKTAFEVLNPEQRRAVTTIEGPVMVLAGPGTGKTHVLACRVAHILATQDIQPTNILALTFTDAAAKNMRERIVKMVGSAGYSVVITTFHSFCTEVMSQYPEYFAGVRDSQPLSDLEKYHLFEFLITETKLLVLKPLGSPLHYLRDVQSSISDLKREGITPEAFEAILRAEQQQLEDEADNLKKTALQKRQKNLAKQFELLTLYVRYQAELTVRSRFDFDDMVSLVAQAFRDHPGLLAEYQEQLQYILVDEYQDTNASQNAVVDALCSFWGEQANVFVVGDPHQSIFRFQGASVENMLGFLTRYPTAEVITLQTGYRCPQGIYDAAHALIAHNQQLGTSEKSLYPQQDAVLATALTTRLISPHAASSVPPLVVCRAATQVFERHYIVNEIKTLVASGVPYSEIAVLYKNHIDAREVTELLSKAGIPFETDYSGNIFDDRYVQQLTAVLRVIAGTVQVEDSTAFLEVLLLDWLHLPRLAIFQLARAASKEKKSLISLLEGDGAQLCTQYGIDPTEFSTLEAWRTKIEALRAQAANKQFHAWFEEVVGEAGLGFFAWLVTNEPNKQHVLALHSLFSEIKKWVYANPQFTIEDFLQAIDTSKAHGLVVKPQSMHATAQAVTLCSVHKAKGREWGYVFVMALRDRKWGNAKKAKILPLPDGILTYVDASALEANQEDRRLFYVALTRAKRQTIVSYAESEVEGKAVRTFIKSMFLTEISEQSTEIPEEALQSLSETLEKQLLSVEAFAPSLPSTTHSERAFFEKLAAECVLSVTALNTYLRDPKQFFYTTLLKIPKAKEAHLCFGTAVHAALEYLYAQKKKGTLVPLERVTAVYLKELHKELIHHLDLETWEKRGIDSLTAYYAAQQNAVSETLYTERKFGSMFGNISIMDGEHEVMLSGRLDRIDLVDAKQRTVRLVDYKTGAAKSYNEIEAATQTAFKELSEREQQLPESIRGPYKRQLIFYTLLAELDPSFRYSVAETVFEFVEPTATGSMVTRSITVTQEEVALLKELVITVMREIRNLEFLPAIFTQE